MPPPVISRVRVKAQARRLSPTTKNTMKIQIGYESKEEGVRLTPIDQTLGIGKEAGTLLKLVALALDGRDADPGDGEVDVALSPSIVKQIKGKVPLLGALIPDEGNLFLRFKD